MPSVSDTDSNDVANFEFVWRMGVDENAPPRVRTAADILHWMKMRRLYYGAPLPEGYVAPPGIDIDELLRQLPPLPPPPDQP